MPSRGAERRVAARSALLVSVLLLALGAALLAGCGGGDEEDATAGASPAAAADAEPIAPGSISLGDLDLCDDDKLPEGLRCGTIDLPYERLDPSLGEIRIAFGVRPRTDRGKPSQGAIIAVEGGPGYGSIGSARGYINTFGDLLDRRELIVVDARGTGSSKPIDCRDLQTGRAPNQIGFAACASQLGPRYDSFRTAAIADDINDVRAALGYDEVQMYGDSYGTFLAQSYAFRHGETLEALVLDSAYPVRGESGWYPSVWRTGIRGLGIACERAPSCRGDAGERLGRFVELLRERQMNVGPFLDALGTAGFSPPDKYLRINRVVEAYLEGDEEPYEEMTREGAAGYGDADGYSFGQELTVSCNDYPMIWDKDASEAERREQLEQEIRDYPKDAFEPFTPREIALTSDVLYLECLTAPRPGELYEPPAEEEATAPDVPVLVIAGELDNVTSPAEGRTVADEFPNSELYTWRNAGHVYALYDSQSKGAVEIRRFLRRNG